jgi:hypothetical protein
LIHHPARIRGIPLKLLKALPVIASTILEDIALVLKWFSGAIIHPEKAKGDMRAYWSEIKRGLDYVNEMGEEDPAKAINNFVGAFLFYFLHHPIELGSQYFLLFTIGGEIIDQFGNGVKSAFQLFGVTKEGSGVLSQTLKAFM